MGLEKVADHFMVPKHEIVPEEKIPELVKKFGTGPEKLPQILSDDPAVAEIGAQKGDVIKISRTSRTAGKTIYFRVVI